MLVEAIETQEVATQPSEEPVEEALIAQLKVLRRQLAQQENVPAYVIFSDATLLELATYLPTQPEDLPRISGFGQVKINKYGEAFLDEINQYCIENDLESRMSKLRRKSRKRRSAETKKTDTKQETYDYYCQGKSVEEISRLRGLQTSTICGHLAYYIQNGSLKITELVDPATVTQIEDAIYLHGDTALRPLKEAVDDKITYDEIRLVIGHCRR